MKMFMFAAGLIGGVACSDPQASPVPRTNTLSAGSGGVAMTALGGTAGAGTATTQGNAPAKVTAGASNSYSAIGQAGASFSGVGGAAPIGSAVSAGARSFTTSAPVPVGGFAAGGRMEVTTTSGGTAGRSTAGGTVATMAGTAGKGGSQPFARAGAASGGGAGGSPHSTVHSGGNAGTTVGTSNPPIVTCPSFTRETSSNRIKLTAKPESNYSFSSNLQLTSQSVAEQSNLEFNWSTLTHDMYGRAIDPKADIAGLVMTIWSYAKTDLEQRINREELVTGDRKGAGYTFTQNRVSGIFASDLTSDGKERLNESTRKVYFSATEFPADRNTHLVMVQSNGKTPGRDVRMFAAFSLSTDPMASKTVTIDNSSTTLEYLADFSQMAPTLVPAGTGDMTIDWASLATNALGFDMDPYAITRVIVASYSLPVSALQRNENFPNLESLATALWESNPDDIINPKLALSKLQDNDGEAFSGIDSTHTWLLALQCTTCLNPAPWYIAVLQACAM